MRHSDLDYLYALLLEYTTHNLDTGICKKANAWI